MAWSIVLNAKSGDEAKITNARAEQSPKLLYYSHISYLCWKINHGYYSHLDSYDDSFNGSLSECSQFDFLSRTDKTSVGVSVILGK